MSPALKKRLPLLVFLLLGLVLWQNGFGLFATERTVVFRLPVSYSQVRAVDLQVWEGEALVGRSERTFSSGVSEELQVRLPMARGQKKAVAVVTLVDGSAQPFTEAFDPGMDATVVVAPKAGKR